MSQNAQPADSSRHEGVLDPAAGDPPAQRVSWFAVGIYYALACLVSWPFFWWRDMASESWAAWGAPGILKTASYMWGPGIAALICLLSFRRRHRRTLTLTGTSVVRSLAFFLFPLGLLAIIGGGGRWADSGHTMPLLVIVLTFATIFGEELGWRGFLQDALRPLTPARRYLLIGVMWEFWHFTNRVHEGTALNITLRLLISYPAVILLSWFIGEAVERSRSLLVAHSLHLWFNLLFEVNSWQATTTFAVALALWIWLLHSWTSGSSWRPWPMRPAAPPPAPFPLAPT